MQQADGAGEASSSFVKPACVCFLRIQTVSGGRQRERHLSGISRFVCHGLPFKPRFFKNASLALRVAVASSNLPNSAHRPVLASSHFGSMLSDTALVANDPLAWEDIHGVLSACYTGRCVRAWRHRCQTYAWSRSTPCVYGVATSGWGRRSFVVFRSQCSHFPRIRHTQVGIGNTSAIFQGSLFVVPWPAI